ncbi:MAG: hypothetical protein M3R37_12635 [Actinomycetota bacterium]|nr:hypothetical protein [Actinomycetota bacterium]
MKRLVLAAAILAAAAGIGASPAAATNECRGLQVCVRVAGPWVVVPSALKAPRPRVDFQLSCPPGYVIGGLDAELSDRAIDVDFLGKLGSPVNPGVTTATAALFRATYTGTAPRGPSFRPHLGCLPASGGGSGPVPFRRPGAFPPGEPTISRVRTARLRPGVVRAVEACAAGERLLSAWHALAFYTKSPPPQPLIQSVSATRSAQGRRVEVRVRSTAAVRGVRAVVQIGAVCGGGS